MKAEGQMYIQGLEADTWGLTHVPHSLNMLDRIQLLST